MAMYSLAPNFVTMRNYVAARQSPDPFLDIAAGMGARFTGAIRDARWPNMFDSGDFPVLLAKVRWPKHVGLHAKWIRIA